MDKKNARVRRGKGSRMKMKEMAKSRLCVHRTPRHIYAQVINAKGEILASASSIEADVRKLDSYTGNVATAEQVGQLVAERAVKNNVLDVAFDRAGFRYHGRVKALAEAARKHGLKF